MSDPEWEPRFRHGDDESGTAEQHYYQRDIPTNDPGIQQRAIRLLEYLEAVRGLKEQLVREVADYQDRRWWAGDIPAHASCVLTPTVIEPWLVVSKAAIPLVPPVPENVVPHLRIRVNNPEWEPAFAVDFEDQFADDPMEAVRLRELLRAYVEGPWQAWAPRARTALQARRLYEDLYDLRLRLQRESAQYELVWGHGISSYLEGGPMSNSEGLTGASSRECR